MPRVAWETFTSAVNKQFTDHTIPKDLVVDLDKFYVAVSFIYDGDGMQREYHIYELDNNHYAVRSWQQRDLLSELLAWGDSGVREG
jgi:hypothetical protein